MRQAEAVARGRHQSAGSRGLSYRSQ
jgi:hypothetical protein